MALIAITAALVVPAVAQAATWSWGFNYVGVSVNTFVPSPWNYYDAISVTKNSGGSILYGFQRTDGAVCTAGLNGTANAYWTASDAGCSGYNRGYVQWNSGATSYLKFDLT